MKKVIFPFIRLMFLITIIIVVILFIAEQLIIATLIPLIWISTGQGVDDVCGISFIKWLAKNKIFPLFEKIGIDKII